MNDDFKFYFACGLFCNYTYAVSENMGDAILAIVLGGFTLYSAFKGDK